MCRARQTAFTTADTLSAVDIFLYVYSHFALPFTGFTMTALALIQMHLIKAESVKQGIDSSKRADVLAKRAVDED